MSYYSNRSLCGTGTHPRRKPVYHSGFMLSEAIARKSYYHIARKASPPSGDRPSILI
jgi:hypothetical protein